MKVFRLTISVAAPEGDDLEAISCRGEIAAGLLPLKHQAEQIAQKFSGMTVKNEIVEVRRRRSDSGKRKNAAPAAPALDEPPLPTMGQDRNGEDPLAVPRFLQR